MQLINAMQQDFYCETVPRVSHESPRIRIICIDWETLGWCMNSNKLGKVNCIKENGDKPIAII